MPHVDPLEIQALQQKADAFERVFGEYMCNEAYVDLMQAIRRFARICDVERTISERLLVPQFTQTSTLYGPVTSAAIMGFDGNPCVKCGAMKMRRVGTCLTCFACGESTGC